VPASRTAERFLRAGASGRDLVQCLADGVGAFASKCFLPSPKIAKNGDRGGCRAINIVQDAVMCMVSFNA